MSKVSQWMSCKNMKNKTIITIFSLIFVAAVIVVFILKKQAAEIKFPENSPNAETRLQQCPDEWIENRMPLVVSETPKTPEKREYFIFKGMRREVEEFDSEWIQKNCNLKKQVVQ